MVQPTREAMAFEILTYQRARIFFHFMLIGGRHFLTLVTNSCTNVQLLSVPEFCKPPAQL